MTQRTADGGQATVALFKPWGEGAPRLSAWRGTESDLSFDPASGLLRSPDDTWLMLPEGEAGDAVARNFFRAGRTVTVSLHADADCSTAFEVDGRSEFEVDVAGAVPVWSAMPTLAWPALAAATGSALRALAPADGAPVTLDLQWAYPGARGSFSEATFCSDAMACGDGEPGRLTQANFSPALTSVGLELPPGTAGWGAVRMLALHGRGADGTGLQANFLTCPARPAGERCW